MRRLSLAPQEPEYPTASELRRATECVAPWALGLPEEADEAGEWAEYGRRRHAIAEEIARKQASAHAHARPEENACELLLFDAIKADRDAAKVGYAWHVEAGIKWRSDGLADEVQLCERRPGERLRGWFSGTADLVYVRHDNVLVVVDWKFGPREHVTGEPAEHSCQGWFLALAFCELLGIKSSGPGVVVARFERRMVREDRIKTDGHDITQGELDAFRVALVGLGERITQGVGALPRISKACNHCKAKAECPAWAVLREELRTRAWDDIRLLDKPPSNDEEARFYRDAIQGLERERDQAKERYAAYLALNPAGVPIGLGMREVGKRIETQTLNITEAATARIRERFGDAAFGAPKPTLGRIEAAVKAWGGKGKSKSDWLKTKATLREELKAEGILLAPSVHTRVVEQRLVASKWVDVRSERVEEDEDDE